MKKLIRTLSILLLSAAIFTLSACGGYNFTDSNELKRPEVEAKEDYGFLITGKTFKDVSYISVYRTTIDSSDNKIEECIASVFPSSFDSLNETYTLEDKSVIATEANKYSYKAKYFYENGKTDSTAWSEPIAPKNTVCSFSRKLNVSAITFTYDAKDEKDRTLTLNNALVKEGQFSNLCLVVEALNEIKEQTATELKTKYEVESRQAIVIDETQTSFLLTEILPENLLDRPIRLLGIIGQFEEKEDADKPVKRVYFSEVATFNLVQKDTTKVIEDNIIQVKSSAGKSGYKL